MKKLLAMVLALVMTLSLAVSASAFKDDDKVSADYAEAAAVLDGMGVFKGYEDGEFKPLNNITRAEVATIIYRIYTGDVAKNDKSGLYATYNKFSDMTGAGWAAGYIGYCANAELVKGYPDGTFKPSGKITGYEVLAMILRAVGYDKNGEFSGTDWAVNVAKYAEQLGILKNVAKTTNLGAPATRELVAEMLFQAIQKDQVTYTPAFGYQTDKALKLDQKTLGAKNFKLAMDDSTSDIWGRPTHTWTYSTGDKKTEFVATPDASFSEATSECDICEALGEKTSAKVVEVYVNGDNKSAEAKGLVDTYKATATKDMVGEQGRIAEYYEVKGGYRLVVIDTYLAQVTDVVTEKLDSKDHVTRDDCMKLKVWNDAKNPNTPDTSIYVEGNDYAEDAYILVHVNAVDKTDIITVANGKAASFPTVEIVGEAKSFTGAQTKTYYQSNKHCVAGEDYMDAYRFYKDVTKLGTVKYTWFLDQFGNLIGNDDIDNTSYAVLKEIYWTGSNRNGYAEAVLVDMDGKESTVTVDQIDGLADQSKDKPYEFIGAFDNTNNDSEPRVNESSDSSKFQSKYAYMSTWDNYNKAYRGMALFMVEPNDDGTVNLQGYDKQVKTDSKTTDVRFVEYAGNATINAKSSILSVYDNEKDATERTAKYAVSSNVEIIVREGNADDGYTYNTEYTLKTLPEYADKSVEAYFVTEGNYVTKIYIKNATDASSFGTYVFMPEANDKNGNSNYWRDDETGKYYANVYVDGKAQTVEVSSEVGKLLSNHQGMLFQVKKTESGKVVSAWETSLTGAYGKLNDAAKMILVDEANDVDEWAANTVSADYISSHDKLLKDDTILISNGASGKTNIINLDESEIVVWDGSEVTKITEETFNEYAVWAVSKKGDYEGAAAYLYLGVKPVSSAKDAADALAGKDLGAIEGTDLTLAEMKEQAVANAYELLEKANISGVKLSVKSTGSWVGSDLVKDFVPDAGHSAKVFFTFTVTDVDGKEATAADAYSTVTSKYSNKSLTAAVVDTLEGLNTITDKMTVAQVKQAVKDAIATEYSLTDINVTLDTDTLAGHSVINVTVKATHATLGEVNASAQIAVQATKV